MLPCGVTSQRSVNHTSLSNGSAPRRKYTTDRNRTVTRDPLSKNLRVAALPIPEPDPVTKMQALTQSTITNDATFGFRDCPRSDTTGKPS